MAVGCGGSCSKGLLVFFNILFWLSGCGLVALGLWMLFDPTIYEKLAFIEVSVPEVGAKLLSYAAYAIIAVGAFVLLVGFCGCCGAIKESKCMLGLYIFCLLIVCLVELAAGVLAIVFREKIHGWVDHGFKNTIDTKWDGAENIALRTAINAAQMEMKCCGWAGKSDYAAVTDGIVPSCCKLENTDTVTAANIAWGGGYFHDEDACKTGSADGMYETTCKEHITKFIEQHSIILIGVGIGVGAVELLGIILACCLCRSIEK